MDICRGSAFEGDVNQAFEESMTKIDLFPGDYILDAFVLSFGTVRVRHKSPDNSLLGVIKAQAVLIAKYEERRIRLSL